MRVCVTGGTGFLGRHTVKVLREAGHEVRVFTRRGSRVDDKEIEEICGSILDADTCTRALAGCEGLIHLAGRVSRDPDDTGELMRLHVEGTRTLLTAAKGLGLQRIVYMSTSGTIGVSKELERVATEEDPYPLDLVRGWPYYLSKIYAEQEALRFYRQEQLPIIVLNPTLLLGPGDEECSSTGDVERFLKGLIPMIPKGGMSFVDVRDVAHATVNALTMGRVGERYLLGSANMTLKEFFGDVARMSGRPAPLFTAPERVTRFSSRLLARVESLGFKGLPLSSIDMEMAAHGWYINSDKAQNELMFSPRDPHDTLFDTIEDVEARI